MHPMLQRRYLPRVGWVGTGFAPTTLRTSPTPAPPPSAGTMMPLRTSAPAAPAPAGFMSFPPGAGSSPAPTPPSSGGSLPRGALTTPMPVSSPFDPGGGTSAGADAQPPSDTTATVYDASGAATTADDAAAQLEAQAQSQFDALTRSWAVAGICAATAAAAWFLGKRVLSVVALVGAGYVGYRALRSPSAGGAPNVGLDFRGVGRVRYRRYR